MTSSQVKNFGVMSSFFGTHTLSPLHDRFFDPLYEAYEKAERGRSCTSLPDTDLLEIGIRRCLSGERTGRGFLAQLEDCCDRRVAPSLFFESLKSQRRCRLIGEVSQSICDTIDRTCATGHDPFATVASLSPYDIYAGDGHYVEHASHDVRIDEKVFATGDMFGLNLRSHSMFLLTHALRGGTRKREHDMHALKRLSVETLRQQAPCGRQVIWVWDRACIDANFWTKLKMQHGVYFVSRAKDNMCLDSLGHLPYDASHPDNAGVTGFELVSVANQALRCVYYTCPVNGSEYTFLSTLTTVEPGIIAHLYRARWDIEKAFEVTKRKLNESKSWGTTQTAKTIHAQMRALAFNLLLLLERRLEKEHDMTDASEQNRRKKRMNDDLALSRKSPALPTTPTSSIKRCCRRLQRT